MRFTPPKRLSRDSHAVVLWVSVSTSSSGKPLVSTIWCGTFLVQEAQTRFVSLHDLVRLSFGLQVCQVHLVSLGPLIRLSRAVNPRLPAEEVHPSEGCTDYLPRLGNLSFPRFGTYL